jgi:hypothetical protein
MSEALERLEKLRDNLETTLSYLDGLIIIIRAQNSEIKRLRAQIKERDDLEKIFRDEES